MLLNLIYGGAGCGKTQRCIELMQEAVEKKHNAILIVPDQYSYTAEKRITERFGGTGPNGAEVLTFSRLIKRYVKRGGRYLSPCGKQMLIYKSVLEYEKKGGGIFSGSAAKAGFTEKMSELISEFKRYLVMPEELKKAAEEESGMLSRKLDALSDIYEEYNKLLEKGFEDSEDDLGRFADFVSAGGTFSDTCIFLDGFSDFLPRHYEVIRAFLRAARSVNITICMPDAQCEGEVFKTPSAAAERLKKLCKEEGAPLAEEVCGGICGGERSKELVHLLENWDERRNIYSGSAKNISLFCARDLYSETEHAAGLILGEVKNGARFRDISVVCTDSDKYSHLIEAVFADYKIPYFTDNKMPVTEHPIILTVLGAFEITDEGWGYESVFRYLRTGFVYVETDGGIAPLDRGLLDRLENYVLRQGIRGRSVWLSDEDWQDAGGVFDSVIGESGTPREDMQKINLVRRMVAAPFKKFYERLSGRRTVREQCEALYRFLCDIHMYEGIGREVEALNRLGMRDEAEQMKEIWNLLMEVIDQAAVTSGEEFLSREHFCAMIKAGLSQAELRIIPPGIDCVSIVAADRNSPLGSKIIIFMGAVAGTLPSEPKSGGILTDRERKLLEEKGIETAGDALSKAEREMFKFYRTVASASEKLCFCYPSADTEGEAKQPSAFLKDLYKMFPGMDISDGLTETEHDAVFNKKQAFLYMMRAVSEPKLKKRAEKAAEYYKDDEEFSHRISMAEYAEAYKKIQPEITAQSARLLYNGSHRYSASRLNDYSACPFSYFVKHGLKAKEQEIRQIQKFEIGSLLHLAVLEYCREVEDGAADLAEAAERWRALDEEKSADTVDKIMEDISLRVLENLTYDRARVRYLLERMRRILLRSTEIVRLSLSQGDYTAVCYEQKFEIEIEWGEKKVGLNGTIDRVDAAERAQEGRIALRIVDYKSGSKAFDVVSVSEKSDMQLVLYAIAATELYKKGALGRAERGLEPSVGGILYNKLRNDMVKCKSKDLDRLGELLKSDMKLDGLVVTGEDELEAAFGMDRSLERGASESEFMKLTLNSAKNALDKRYSRTVSRERFDILTNFVKKAVVRIDEEIFDGNIAPKPSGGKNQNACSFCRYKEICFYDARFGNTAAKKADEAWEYMENEVKE